MGYPSPLCSVLTGHPLCGKAQVTRDPTGSPEADDAWGPLGPPRLRPPRASTAPFPRAPAPDLGPPDPRARDRWDGSIPGYEFEVPLSQSGPGTRRAPADPGRRERGVPSRPPRSERPGETRSEEAGGEPRRFRYTPTVSQPLSVPRSA